MSSLAIVAVVAGSVSLVIFGLLGIWPAPVARWVARFPRQVWSGRILTVVDIAWGTVLLLNAHFIWIDQRPLLVYILAPVLAVLIMALMDDLLAARALGGLCLLIPVPMLAAAFLQDSLGRLVVTALAYLLAIMGMVLLWSPYMLRKLTERWIHRPAVCQLVALVGCALGCLLLGLGLVVY